MSDEPTLRTKTDVLDLVIGFIVEHEKRMDEMVARMESMVEKMSRGLQRVGVAPQELPRLKPDSFTLTISNPENYDKIKSIMVEWEAGQKEFTPELSEIDAILDEIEHTFKTDHL
jgi:hypothetical protein